MAEDDEQNPERVGLVVMEPGRPFVHYCAVCGARGGFYDVDPSKSRLGRWYSGVHRPDREEGGRWHGLLPGSRRRCA